MGQKEENVPFAVLVDKKGIEHQQAFSVSTQSVALHSLLDLSII